MLLKANKAGAVTAADIQVDAGIEVLNPDQIICTLDKKHALRGRDRSQGRPRLLPRGEQNKKAEQAIGVIPIDSLFSPVRAVKYAVENTRVGQLTDYDKLILEIWTDGRITPGRRAAAGLLDPAPSPRRLRRLRQGDRSNSRKASRQVSEEKNKLRKLLNMCVNEIELRVRAANCLNNANITTVGELAHEDRSGDAQVPQLRQEVAQRDQGEARSTSASASA